MKRLKIIGHNRRRFVLLVVICLTSSAGVLAQARKSTPVRSITVVTEPAATVWVDGVRYGVTDDNGRLVISSVSPGVRVLRVRAAGFAELSKSLPAA